MDESKTVAVRRILLSYADEEGLIHHSGFDEISNIISGLIDSELAEAVERYRALGKARFTRYGSKKAEAAILGKKI